MNNFDIPISKILWIVHGMRNLQESKVKKASLVSLET
jgi:hypothetical protein